MADDKLAALLATQKSLTEWLQDIDHQDAELLRREDNDKRERLKQLNEIIGLPYDKPTQFTATHLAENDPALVAFVKEHGDELCALRLIPLKDGLPKLRMRGKTISQAMNWFREQKITPSDYRADFMPHIEIPSWATIFVVNKHGIQGEIIKGGHHQLTQGFHETATPLVFKYDFSKWLVEPDNSDALQHLQWLAGMLKVDADDARNRLEKELGATFSNNYLEGYFETTSSDAGDIWFIDYSPVLGKLYSDLAIEAMPQTNALVQGRIGCKGIVEGTVRIVPPDGLDADFPEGSVLVCSVTTPNYVPLMQKAAAIVTDQGGILSHAAIVARELGKPCIVGTANATSLLHNGQTVRVDADKGTVTLL